MSDCDYLIIGGGSAGCVLANRLSENPATKVVLLEAGSRDTSPWIHLPAGMGRVITSTKYNWWFDSEPEPNLHNRRIPMARGKVLGGSSSINGMLYVRGHPSDYDQWAQMGNRGWSYQEVLPYFQKSENCNFSEGPSRGQGGPLEVSRVTSENELANVFIKAALAEGFAFNADYNSGDQDGFGHIQVTQKNGQRWSAARGYLHPVLDRKNLEVRTDAKVLRLELKDGRCTGAVYERDGRRETISAQAEVILAAGAVQSPQLLELSGIGCPQILSAAGVPVVKALPGVGRNYRDHFSPKLTWRVKKPVSLNDRARGLPLAGEVLRYALTRRGLLSLPIAFAVGFVRSRPGLVAPDIQYHFLPLTFEPGTRKLESRPGMTVNLNPQRPNSTGSIHIKTGNPHQAPSIRTNFLADGEDQRVVVEGLKIARRIVANTAFDPYRAFELQPGDAVRSNDEYLDYARATGLTTYHAVGTCRMGADADPHAVVDDNLRVHGIDGLRVVDASVMPTLVSGNTNAPVMMIAERAADLIKSAARA